MSLGFGLGALLVVHQYRLRQQPKYNPHKGRLKLVAHARLSFLDRRARRLIMVCSKETTGVCIRANREKFGSRNVRNRPRPPTPRRCGAICVIAIGRAFFSSSAPSAKSAPT